MREVIKIRIKVRKDILSVFVPDHYVRICSGASAALVEKRHQKEVKYSL